jgi:hypothetical protein
MVSYQASVLISLLNCIVDAIRYLKAVRSKPMDLTVKEGVDTLLLRLLLEAGASDEMEMFAASENDCAVVCTEFKITYLFYFLEV